MNDILQGLIYYLKNNTHVSIIYLDELLGVSTEFGPYRAVSTFV